MVKPAQAPWVSGAGEHGWIRGIKASKLKGKDSLGRGGGVIAQGVT
jgi:hypothetical protein